MPCSFIWCQICTENKTSHFVSSAECASAETIPDGLFNFYHKICSCLDEYLNFQPIGLKCRLFSWFSWLKQKFNSYLTEYSRQNIFLILKVRWFIILVWLFAASLHFSMNIKHSLKTRNTSVNRAKKKGVHLHLYLFFTEQCIKHFWFK